MTTSASFLYSELDRIETEIRRTTDEDRKKELYKHKVFVMNQIKEIEDEYNKDRDPWTTY